MRRNEATAFENEYFYDKKGNLKVRNVLKGRFPTGQRPRLDKKHTPPKTKDYSDVPKRMWPNNSSNADRFDGTNRTSWFNTPTRADDFDNNDSSDYENFDSDEPDYDSQTEWSYGDVHNDAGNDW